MRSSRLRLAFDALAGAGFFRRDLGAFPSFGDGCQRVLTVPDVLRDLCGNGWIETLDLTKELVGLNFEWGMSDGN